MPEEFKRSALAMAVLGVLAIGPMHPYGIQRRLRELGKEDVINVSQRASLYKTIGRLEAAGLVTGEGPERERRYPERTAYAITAAGRETAERWVAEMLADVRPEYPAFPAALSFAPLLGPAAVRRHLDRRHTVLVARLAALRAEPDEIGGRPLPPVVLLDSAYRRTVLAAELAWVEDTLRALTDGSLTWATDDLIALIPSD